MRFLLPLALALAACSSDPTDQNPPPPQDVQATDIGVDATDTGVDRLVVDVSDDRPAPIDNGTPDAGVDASFHSDPIPLADLGFDLGAGDAGGDAGCAELFCGGRCVESSPMNCGACGVVCTTSLPHARPTCTGTGPDASSMCGWGCEVGWGNCDRDDTNGCEYSLFGIDSGFCP